ncbi:MAG: M20 family metallopeptidase [Pyrinomonadaceae bacterium]
MPQQMTLEISRQTMTGLREYAESRVVETLKLTRALVETESPSGDEAGSRAVVSLLADAARAIDANASIERIESAGYGEHLRVRFFEDAPEGLKSVLLIGHTDTVYPRGTLQTRPYRKEKSLVYGPGIFDMKANCALALESLRACLETKLIPHRPVVLLLTCDEEVGSFTGRALVEEEACRAESVLVLEPSATNGRAKTGRRGTGLFKIFAEGRAAHAGLEPEKGVSAILEIARQIERLHALNQEGTGISVNVGVVRGGTTSNVVAAEAVAEVDVRFSTAEESRRIEKELLDSKPFDPRVKLRVEGGINRPPLERNGKVVALYKRARSLAALLDYELGEAQVGGASDGNFAAATGAAVLDGLGLTGDGAHAIHEHIVAADIAPRIALLAALINSI